MENTGSSDVTNNDSVVYRFWRWAFHEVADHRVNRWPMMENPLPLTAILLAYLLFVLKVGPYFMEKRRPFELKNTLILYNFLQVLVSLWIVREAARLYSEKYSLLKCESVERDSSEESMRICWGFYVYHLAKISELLDTVFFVLRKKYNQITFLHLYHHTGMPVLTWGCTKYFPGGHAAFIGFINSLVHVIMYFYYMLAAMGPGIQKHLWWKKWITIMQLAQFIIAGLHFSIILSNEDCNYPKWAIIIVFPNTVFFLYLFYDFYRKAYSKTTDKEEKVSHPEHTNLEAADVVSNGKEFKSTAVKRKNIRI